MARRGRPKEAVRYRDGLLISMRAIVPLRRRTLGGHAAASFWSIHDPINVRGAKDLLVQAIFAMTEKHYIMTQSRLAGRALAQMIESVKGQRARR